MTNDKQSKGYTLLEIMLVLGVITAFSVAGIATYANLHARGQVLQAVQSARDLSNNLMSTYGQSGSFSGLTTAGVAEHNEAPGLTVQGQTLLDPWGGQVTLESVNSNTQFAVTYTHVPREACANVASQLSKDFAEIQVNGTQVSGDGQPQVDVVMVTKLCGLNDQNTLELTSLAVAQPNFGEVPLLLDHGNPRPVIATPSTKGATTALPVSAVLAVSPDALAKPTTLGAPMVSSSGSHMPVTGTVTSEPTPSTSFPGTALPPQTCFPSTVVTPVSSAVTEPDGTNACPAGYTGVITLELTGTQTVTTTKVTTCGTPWSTPVINQSSQMSTVWNPTPVVIGNTCATMCSTRLASGGFPTPAPQYQWGPTGPGPACPAGYTGSITLQYQQVDSATVSCPSPSSPVNPTTNWSGWHNDGATQVISDTCQSNTPTATGNGCTATGIFQTESTGPVSIASVPGTGTTVFKTCTCKVTVSYGGSTQQIYTTATAFSSGGVGYYGYATSTVNIGGGNFLFGVVINASSTQTGSGTKWNSTCSGSVLMPGGSNYP